MWKKFLEWREIPFQFPREMLKERIKIESQKKYLSIISATNGRKDVFVSLYPEVQSKEKIVDVIFFEIDADSLLQAESLASKIEVILEKNEVSYRRFYTGHRGFHYYLPIEPLKLSYPSRTVRTFLEKMGIMEYVDHHVVGNIKQLVRVPYTLHPKTRLYSFETYGDIRFSDCYDPPMIEKRVPTNGGVTKLLMGIEVLRKERVGNTLQKSFIHLLDIYLPECILSIIEELRDGSASHRKRLHLGAFLRKMRVDINEAVDLFRSAEDFKEGYTRYQLRKIYSHDFSCHSCVNARFYGICPLSFRKQRDCIYYPSINLFLRDDLSV